MLVNVVLFGKRVFVDITGVEMRSPWISGGLRIPRVVFLSGQRRAQREGRVSVEAERRGMSTVQEHRRLLATTERQGKGFQREPT